MMIDDLMPQDIKFCIQFLNTRTDYCTLHYLAVLMILCCYMFCIKCMSQQLYFVLPLGSVHTGVQCVAE